MFLCFTISVFRATDKPLSVVNHFLDTDCVESYEINEVNLMVVTFYLSSNMSLLSLKKVNMPDKDTREAMSASTLRMQDVDVLFKVKISIKKFFILSLREF